MEEQYNEIDNIFRSKLAEHQSVTPEHIWTAIDEKRTTVQRTKNIWRRNQGVASGLFLLFLVGVAAIWYSSQKETILLTKNTTTNTIIKDENKGISTKQSTLENYSSPSESTTKKFKAKASDASKVDSKDAVLTQLNSSQRPSPSTDYQFSKNVNQNTSQGVKYQSALTSKSKQNESNQPKSFDILTPISEEQRATLKQVNGLTGLKDRTLETKKNTAQAALGLDFSLNKIDPLTPVVPLFVPSSGVASLRPFETICTDPNKCGRRFGGEKMKAYHYLETFASVGYTQHLFKPVLDTYLNEKYIGYRKLTESAMPTIAVGGRYSIVLENGLALKTGLTLTQMTDRIEYDHENAVQNNELGTLAIIWTNFYRTLDVPLMLGYELEKDKFTFALNAGVNFNILVDAEGIILAMPSYTEYTDVEPISYGGAREERVNYDIYKNRTNLKLASSFGLYYEMNRSMQWLIEPQVVYTPQSITNQSFTLEHRYLDFGMRVGIRYAWK